MTELLVQRNIGMKCRMHAENIEVLTDKQRQIQSRKPLNIEYSFVFPIMQRCRTSQSGDVLKWKRRGWRQVVAGEGKKY